MRGQGERHGNREGISICCVAPLLVICERQFPRAVLSHATHLPALDNGDEFLAHFLLPRATATMESISTGGAPSRFFVGASVSVVSRIPSVGTVRSRRPISALGLPFSTSTIHCRLTPTFWASDRWSRASLMRRSRRRAP